MSTHPTMVPRAGEKEAKAAAAAAKKARKEARRAIRRKLEATTASTIASLNLSPTAAINLGASQSNANRPLPAPPPSINHSETCTVCLFYQYVEPAWTAKEHRAALNKVTELATKHRVTGRGRCAPEGLNCTLTASANDVRGFCYALRAWDPAFDDTDFKLEDGVPNARRFRTFTLRKTDELVGYALDGVKAPSLARHAGKHLEAPEYHKQMQSKDTVIIDVRNAYESDIGHFQPPEGGAELLDPKMRTSQDFPKWLNAPETKEKLQNKTVMMYCTGGIRCERATALLNQITDAEEDFKTKDVVMVRGGIERYLKTFPEGGYWKGKNYLFDKRMEQTPTQKSSAALEKDVESACCLCRKPYASYLGQHKCGMILPTTGAVCAVPVIVCDDCQIVAAEQPARLGCSLCAEGYYTPENTAPDLVGQKRKLGIIAKGGTDMVTGQKVNASPIAAGRGGISDDIEISRRLFVGKLPLTITASKLRAAFGNINGAVVSYVQWIVDRDSRAFYGSAYCQMASENDARLAIEGLERGLYVRLGPARKGGKKRRRAAARVAFAPMRAGEVWPPPLFEEKEYPPIGCSN